MKEVWLSWFVFVSHGDGRLGLGEEKMEFDERIVTILVVWPKNVSMRQGSKLVIFQM